MTGVHKVFLSCLLKNKLMITLNSWRYAHTLFSNQDIAHEIQHNMHWRCSSNFYIYNVL